MPDRCWTEIPRKLQYSGNHRLLEFPVSASESPCTSASKFRWSQSVAFPPYQHSCAAAGKHQHAYNTSRCSLYYIVCIYLNLHSCALQMRISRGKFKPQYHYSSYSCCFLLVTNLLPSCAFT